MNDVDRNINKQPNWISMVLPTIVTGVLSWFLGKFVELTLRTEYISGFLEATRLETADVAEIVKLLSEVYSVRALLDFVLFLFFVIVISFLMVPYSWLLIFLQLVLFAIYVGARLHIEWLRPVVFIVLSVILVTIISWVRKKCGDIGLILFAGVLLVLALVLTGPLLHLLFFEENASPEAHTAADIFVNFLNLIWGFPGLLIVSFWLIFVYFKNKHQKQSLILMPRPLQNKRSQEINRAKLVASVIRVIIIIIVAGYIYLVARFGISYSAQMAKYNGWVIGVEKVCNSPQVALPGVEPNQPTFLLEHINSEIFVFTTTVRTAMPTPRPEFGRTLITHRLYATSPFSIGCSPAIIDVLPVTETFKILPPDARVKPGECCHQLFGPTPTPAPTPAPTPKPHISLRKLND